VAFRRLVADAAEHVDPLYVLTDAERRDAALVYLNGGPA